MRSLILIFVFLTQSFLFGGHDISHDAPQVVRGVLDLTHWDLKKKGIICLDGKWEFYWGKFVEPASFIKNTNPAPDTYIQVPGTWNGEIIRGETLRGDGYATYRMKIVSDSLPERLAIHMPTISTAYDLYVDGKKIFSVGKTGKTKAEMVPAYNPHVIDFVTDKNEIDIALHISNFYYPKGGFWKTAVFGRQTDVWNKQTFALIVGIFVGGVLILNGLYHMAMYPIRFYTKAPIYFGIFSIVIGIRSLITGHIPLHYMIPVLPWWLIIRMEYLTVYIGLPLFLHYLQSVFTEDKSPKVYYGLLACYALLALSVLITPVRIFTKGLDVFLVIGAASVVYGLMVVVRALIYKREGSRLFLIATLILLAAFINDILVGFDIIYADYLIPYALLIFIMIQSMMLAYRLSYAYKTVDQQREELIVHRSHLKELVNERTGELTESNAMKELLLDIITHDLKNPAGVINGMTSLLIKDRPKDELLNTVHSSSRNLLKVIQNATTLSKVAVGDQLEKESLDLIPMMKEAVKGFSTALKNTGMTIEYDLPKRMVVRAHPILIEVFKNYISNAIKYASDGKKILLKMTWDMENITASVIDYGAPIPEEAYDKVFTRSLQLSSKNRGRGLGLAIVKRIAEVHGYRVGVKRAETGGNEFYIKIPVSG